MEFLQIRQTSNKYNMTKLFRGGNGADTFYDTTLTKSKVMKYLKTVIGCVCEKPHFFYCFPPQLI